MKKLLKITLALMMALCLQLTSFNSVHALNNDLSKAGTYQVPIKSLTQFQQYKQLLQKHLEIH